MKYLIVLYASYNDGKASKKAMYEYDTPEEAIAAFHGYLNTHMKDSTVQHVMVDVVDTNGLIVRRESYTRPEES